MVKGRYVTKVLSVLASMPFLTVAELAEAAGQHDRTVRDTLYRLQEAALVEAITHSLAPKASAQRWCLTSAGIAELARRRRHGESPDDLLGTFPLGTRWQRNLLGRLDAVAVINRMARGAAAGWGPGFTWRWERRDKLDAVFRLESGRSAGVVRIGSGLSGDRVAGRVGRLLTLYEKEELEAALIIVPGPIDVQQIRRLTAARRMLLFVAFERDLIQAPPHAPIWRRLGGNDRMELTEVLRQVPVAELPRTMQPQGRGSIPVATLSQGPGSMELLASELTIPEKRMLDLLHDWPIVSTTQLRRMLGVSEGHMRRIKGRLSKKELIHHLRIGRTAAQRYRNETRICLSDTGLRYLARRDRAGLPDMMAWWSVKPDPAGDETFRVSGHRIDGTKVRTLAKELRHTTETYEVVSHIMDACLRSRSWKVAQILPAHRWERRYRYGTRRNRKRRDIWRAIKPDAVLILDHQQEQRSLSFIIEYERRANVPARMEERIQRYRAYYGSPDTTHDFPDRPTLLVVFQAREDASRFVSHASRPSSAQIPMLVSSIEEIERVGNALGNCWMMPWRLDEGSVPIWALARGGA